PVFWTGILLLLVFGGMLGWLPLGGIIDGSLAYRRITGAPLLDGLVAGNWTIVRSSVRHLVLPAVALGSTAMAAIARMARSTMLDVLGLDFIRTARAKGLAERRVVSRHALRNALLPVVTLVGLQLGLLLSGAVLTETIFALPGLGRLAITSVLARDYPMVQGVVLIAAAVFAPALAPFDPVEQAFTNQLLAPSRAHLFGTDEFGRDIFSRVIYGARIALVVGVVADGIAALLGVILGVISGYFGRRVDAVI